MSGVEWRKSSYSNASGGACVELGWKKSSYSNGDGGACVELGWKKSSHSNASGGTCVELAFAGAIRDSKNPGGPVITVSRSALESFVAAAKRR